MVASFTVQPIKLELQVGDEIQRYFPDVHVFLANGKDVWCEVKPEARLAVARVAARMSAARTHFVKDRSAFVVVTDTWLHQEPRCSNVAGLMYHRRDPIPPLQIKAVERKLHSTAPKVLADLEEQLGKDLAWRLLGAGVVGLDLEKVIQADSQIFLTGGHRHADFCA
jgi:hypothetical protein